MKVGIVIPTILRADTLARALKSIADCAGPADVRIIRNWTHKGVERVCAEFEATSTSDFSVTIDRQTENLGCARSWNRGLKHLFDAGHDWAIVMNDDAVLTENAVAVLRQHIEAGALFVISSSHYSCFAIHKKVIEKVGWFDENFWPAYHEDNDFAHRLLLGGIETVRAFNAVVEHEGSATVRSAKALYAEYRARFEHKNVLYYRRKWGGLPGDETFANPFNDGRNAISFWTEPPPKAMRAFLDDNDVVQPGKTEKFTARVYGPMIGNGSFCRVAKGVTEGFEELGMLAGTVNTDADDPAEIHEAPGRGATIGVYIGAPSRITVTALGGHDSVFSVLAPNSSWLPPLLLANLSDHSFILSPSEWGANVIAEHGHRRLPSLKHGVSRKFRPISAMHDKLRASFEDGDFVVLHLSSSDRQRKGTAELLEAWQRLVSAGKLGPRPKLVAVVDMPRGTFPAAEADPTIRFSTRRLDAGEEAMATIYQSCHLVCQPSRGEGFGMCPVEARACGVPVVATDVTGHTDHMVPTPPGCVVVATGPDAPIDDGPGALAPSLSVDAVADALATAYADWRKLHDAALANAEAVGEHWSWSNQTKRWLQEMQFWRTDD